MRRVYFGRTFSIAIIVSLMSRTGRSRSPAALPALRIALGRRCGFGYLFLPFIVAVLSGLIPFYAGSAAAATVGASRHNNNWAVLVRHAFTGVVVGHCFDSLRLVVYSLKPLVTLVERESTYNKRQQRQVYDAAMLRLGGCQQIATIFLLHPKAQYNSQSPTTMLFDELCSPKTPSEIDSPLIFLGGNSGGFFSKEEKWITICLMRRHWISLSSFMEV